MEEAVKGNIPLKRNSSRKKNIFMTANTLKLKDLKLKQWNKYKQTKSIADFNIFKISRDQLRSTTRRLRKGFELKLTADIKRKPKPFWKYIKSRLKTRPDIPTLNLSNEQQAVTSLEKAVSLNNYFSSVFTEETTENMPEAQLQFEGIPLTTVDFSPQTVKEKILKLNENKSPGPDSVHPFFVKKLVNVLCTPISILFTLSMKTETNVNKWCEVIITAIHKKGPKNLAKNYRPISLTSVICKLMESFIRDAILNHMVRGNLFTNAQHRFVPRRNCSTQLLEAVESWSRIIENKGCIDVIYTDFSKAFDSVPHKRLLKKIESYGIKGNVLNWIKSFLTNRKQRVNVEGKVSDWATVKSGVPQGSVLGPILFVIYINDMPNVVTNACKLFVDDAKIFADASKRDTKLQEDMTNFVCGPTCGNYHSTKLNANVSISDEIILDYRAP